MMRVRVDGTVVFEKPGSVGPKTSSVDLSRYAGRDIRLALAAQTTEAGSHEASRSEPFILAGTEQRHAALPAQTMRAGFLEVVLRLAFARSLDFSMEVISDE